MTDARTVKIDVRGLPRPQGSMRLHALPNGKQVARYPAAVYAWRAQVQQAVAEVVDDFGPFTSAIAVRLGFDLPRPLGHFGTGKNSALVKPSAPGYPTVAPDLDKLVRCINDAITDAGLWKDDAQVVSIQAGKRYVTGPPGVLIVINEVEQT